MRLLLLDCQASKRINFYPLALSRPIFDLRFGMTTLGEKLTAKLGAGDVACFVPPYMADVCRAKTERLVNDLATLRGDDLLLVNGRVKAGDFDVAPLGPSEVAVDEDGEVLYARIAKDQLAKLKAESIESLLDSAKAALPAARQTPPAWNYAWDLILANRDQLPVDFAAIGRFGIQGTVEEPCVIRGNRSDVYIAHTAVVHPMVVIDVEHGPVYLDEGVIVHPFTRIEGPCYVGKNSILLGTKCREGNSIGPMCRIGGEIEESIIQGHSNKYHEGFLGHAYVGEWVNLAAMTTNSDLKNDYSNVTVVLDGKKSIDTGSTKVGSLIGDHTKTAIGTLINTGGYIGAMTLIATTGRLLPKFIPSFTWHIDGAMTEGSGRDKLYATAKRAMSRRQCDWTEADEALWNAVHEMTTTVREEAIGRSRKLLGDPTKK